MSAPVVVGAAVAALATVIWLGVLDKLRHFTNFRAAVAAYRLLPDGLAGMFAGLFVSVEVAAAHSCCSAPVVLRARSWRSWQSVWPRAPLWSISCAATRTSLADAAGCHVFLPDFRGGWWCAMPVAAAGVCGDVGCRPTGGRHGMAGPDHPCWPGHRAGWFLLPCQPTD